MATRDIAAELKAAEQAAKAAERALRKLQREAKRLASTERPRGQVRLRDKKYPDVWRVRVYTGHDVEGKRTYKSETVRGSRKAAEDRLAVLLGEKGEGRLGPPSKDSVAAWLAKWMKTVEVSKRARTVHGYRTLVDRYLVPYLGKVPLAKLSPADVTGMIAEMRAKGIGPRVTRQAWECLRIALNVAVRQKVVRETVRSADVRDAFAPRQVKPMATVPSEMVPKFLEVARGERLGAAFVVQLFSGCRPGEALALRWSDVSGTSIHIERSLVDVLVGVEGKDPFEPTKTGRARTVEVPALVSEFLKAHRARQVKERQEAGDRWQEGDLVFSDELGRPIPQAHLRWHFKTFAKTVGLDPAVTPYSLRHSCASLLLELGEDYKVIQQQLGHARASMTVDVYAHLSAGAQARASKKLGTLAKKRSTTRGHARRGGSTSGVIGTH